MRNLNLEIAENINKTLAKGVMERSKDFYNLAFFLSGEAESALKNVKDCVSAGLFNARKIQTVPPVKTWFYQELVALCIKRGSSSESTATPTAYNKKSFKKLSSMESQTKAVFALYYFEELGKGRVAKVLRIKEPAVREKLGYACRELGITGENQKRETDIFAELIAAYRSPKPPSNFRKEIRGVIDKERELNKDYFTKDRKNRRIRIVLGLAVLAMLAYLVYSGGVSNIF